MKPIRFILLLMISVAYATAFAQAPQKFNYQAVARDASGNPLSEKNIAVRISIIEGSAGGATLYRETFNVATGKQGLFAIQIGGGSPVSGTFGSIVWASGSRFLKVEIDTNGGSAFTTLGTSQLLSVPYAFAADKLSSPMSIADLSDVSDTAPSVDQILKWDGTSWVPGSAPGGGSITTSASLSGDGSAGSPLTIAAQNATSGQVLQWNGTEWKPATVSGGVGDNWGTQSVVTTSVLSGNGTTGAPLTISNAGATNGQVLKYNGTTWTPAADGGDNWGTAKVNTSAQFAGDGTPGNPLKLGANSADVGQALVWDGVAWIPGDVAGGLTLPYSTNTGVVGTALQILSSGGPSIEGTTTNNGADMTGVKGIVSNATAGVGSAGVFGRNIANNGNGYGVLGVHESTGSGVFGEAKGGAGYGVFGRANGANGVGTYGTSSGAFGYGIYGLGNTGVAGISNTPNGNGVYGEATNGGYAGWFDERVIIKANSTAAKGGLTLTEVEAGDYARLRFDNNNVAKYWDLTALLTANLATDRFRITNWNGNDVMVMTGDGAVGIGVASPLERLDVGGTIKLTGGIRAGGSLGNAGQVLKSTASGVAWGSSTTQQFNNTYLFWQDGTSNNNISTQENSMSGLNNMTFTITSQARVAFTFSHGQLVSNGTGDVDLRVKIGFINAATGAVVNQAICNDVILNNKKTTFSYTHHCHFGTPGTYWPFIYIGTNNGGQFHALGNAAGFGNTGQAVLHVVQD